METIINFACENAIYAPYLFFGLLMLAGFNIPISEDIIIIGSGALAGTCIPEHRLYLFAWIYAGSWTSAWIAYWIGRHFGPNLYTMRWFRRIITPHRIEKLHHYYEKFGVFTFIVGRFCPGGVRNALFMTAGLGKMPFLVFILRDGFACIISSITLFSIGYIFAENYQTIVHYVVKYQEVAIGIAIVLFTSLIIYLWRHSQKRHT